MACSLLDASALRPLLRLLNWTILERVADNLERHIDGDFFGRGSALDQKLNTLLMARESIPANPIDEQILTLKRQIANGINEMELIQEKHSAQVSALEHTIATQASLINQLTTEKRELFTDLQSLIVPKQCFC